MCYLVWLEEWERGKKRKKVAYDRTFSSNGRCRKYVQNFTTFAHVILPEGGMT
jgi:hypothetical protein